MPVFYGDHVHHAASFERFVSFDKMSGCCGAHSLTEVYATLTRMPGRHRAGADQAMLFLNNIQERLTVIALNGEEHFAALQAAAEVGIVGGGTYDALLSRCAIKAEAETIFTWNLRHYRLCGPEVLRRLQTP